MSVGRGQPANPNLQLVMRHRKNPAVTVSHPVTPQHETDPIAPTRGTARVSLEQPFHPFSAEQGVVLGLKGDASLPLQMPPGSRGIHHKVDRSKLRFAS